MNASSASCQLPEIFSYINLKNDDLHGRLGVVVLPVLVHELVDAVGEELLVAARVRPDGDRQLCALVLGAPLRQVLERDEERRLKSNSISLKYPKNIK